MEQVSEELAEALKQARSIESKPEAVKVEQIGRVIKGDWIIVLYSGPTERVWYESRYMNENGDEISEYEKVFGKKRSKRR